MLKATRAALEAYASGMGLPAADVIREFKALPEGDKFRMLAAIKDLEKAHAQWEANGGKLPAPPAEQTVPAPPPVEQTLVGKLPMLGSDDLARQMRAEYLRTGVHPGRASSLIVDRMGRPHRRD